MISDVLTEAMFEIEEYLDWDIYKDKDGNPDPEIVGLVDYMHDVLVRLLCTDNISDTTPEVIAKGVERKIKEKYGL